MRELKFRAWTRQNPPMPWSQKFVAMTGNGEQMIPIGGTFTGAWHVLGDDAEGLIIEQYTGLKDKNGKEIYEGDIVKAGCRTYEVDWLERDGGWFCFTNDDYYTPLYHIECEVIGNIHENGDLLGDTNITNKEEEK